MMKKVIFIVLVSLFLIPIVVEAETACFTSAGGYSLILNYTAAGHNIMPIHGYMQSGTRFSPVSGSAVVTGATTVKVGLMVLGASATNCAISWEIDFDVTTGTGTGYYNSPCTDTHGTLTTLTLNPC
jgi:hypothetical protein